MRLYEFFKVREQQGQPLVLVTVFETAGSTYSKAGGQMIIDSDGNFCGMLSGGCLEGDLVERARNVVESGVAATASYDLGADDELWGLGVGCDGTMRMLLQPLTSESDYQPFAAIADILDGGKAATLAVVISSTMADVETGASVILQEGTLRHFGMNEADAQRVCNGIDEAVPASMRELRTEAGDIVVLISKIVPSPALLVLGAGLDSEPIVRFATELGWRCSVNDHRPAYIENRDYPDGTTTLGAAAETFSDQVDMEGFDMAIVMSHHLVSDRAYLEQLAESNIGYIGLLGPPGRRQRLMSDLGDTAGKLHDRLHGPAGIRLGGRGPGPIALEIVAEMQQYLSNRG